MSSPTKQQHIVLHIGHHIVQAVTYRQLGVAGSTLLWGCLGANKQEKASDGLELGARGAGWGCGVWGLRGAGAGKPFGACAVKF